MPKGSKICDATSYQCGIDLSNINDIRNLSHELSKHYKEYHQEDASCEDEDKNIFHYRREEKTLTVWQFYSKCNNKYRLACSMSRHLRERCQEVADIIDNKEQLSSPLLTITPCHKRPKHEQASMTDKLLQTLIQEVRTMNENQREVQSLCLTNNQELLVAKDDIKALQSESNVN
ncbi:hypothetical protein BGZ76_003069 [Entomortierella beljakovae]|nr:hypothetical protein BGZ76_003069 [Entomortierella beljakovae]